MVIVTATSLMRFSSLDFARSLLVAIYSAHQKNHRGTETRKGKQREIPGQTRELISPGLTWNFALFSPLCLCASVVYLASGSGLIWKCTTLPFVPLSPTI